MSYTLEFNPALADEIEELKQWHELKRKGLGDKFYAELLHQFQLITENPLIYAVQKGGVRVVRLMGSRI